MARRTTMSTGFIEREIEAVSKRGDGGSHPGAQENMLPHVLLVGLRAACGEDNDLFRYGLKLYGLEQQEQKLEDA